MLEGSVVICGMAPVMASSTPAGSVASIVSSNSSSSVLEWFMSDAAGISTTSIMG